MSWLAYLHPIAMVGVVGLGLLVLREGLRLRRARLRRRPVSSRAHRRLAKPFVALLLLGYGAGLVSMSVLRGRPLLESFHSLLTSGVLVCAVAAGILGLRLERRPAVTPRTAHVAAGSLGLLLALAAAIAGFSILP